MKVSVDIYRNKMVFRSGSESKTISPESPFTMERLLVGTFLPAVECLMSGLKQMGAIGFLKSKPKLVIAAKELNQGGLSEVEERCLLELGYSCGAGKVSVRHE